MPKVPSTSQSMMESQFRLSVIYDHPHNSTLLFPHLTTSSHSSFTSLTFFCFTTRGASTFFHLFLQICIFSRIRYFPSFIFSQAFCRFRQLYKVLSILRSIFNRGSQTELSTQFESACRVFLLQARFRHVAFSHGLPVEAGNMLHFYFHEVLIGLFRLPSLWNCVYDINKAKTHIRWSCSCSFHETRTKHSSSRCKCSYRFYWISVFLARLYLFVFTSSNPFSFRHLLLPFHSVWSQSLAFFSHLLNLLWFHSSSLSSTNCFHSMVLSSRSVPQGALQTFPFHLEAGCRRPKAVDN